MLKRSFIISSTIMALLCSVVWPAYPAGTINLSLSQQLDNAGNPLNGCLLYLYQAGTTNPQSAYSDAALTIPFPNPMSCDSAGRLPQFFLADGQIKIRLSTSAGITVLAADNLLVIGPSAGAAGGGSVDVTTVLATGDIKVRYGTGALTGFVRGNGLTIGSGASGATERANNDCQALFEYLWTVDAALVVSGGRGASANADWLANKQIATPDYRGVFLAGFDDMGAADSGKFPAGWNVLGVAGGSVTNTITTGNMPEHFHGFVTNNDGGGNTGQSGDHSHGGATGQEDVPHTHDIPGISGSVSAAGSGGAAPFGTAASGAASPSTLHTHTISPSGTHLHSFPNHQHSGQTSPNGSGIAMTIIPPVRPVTVYFKL